MVSFDIKLGLIQHPVLSAKLKQRSRITWQNRLTPKENLMKGLKRAYAAEDKSMRNYESRANASRNKKKCAYENKS